jgi:hypothetical protein
MKIQLSNRRIILVLVYETKYADRKIYIFSTHYTMKLYSCSSVKTSALKLCSRDVPGGGGRFLMAVNAKMHVSEQKFNVRKCKTVRPGESYLLVTTVLVVNSRCGKIHNIFLTTIMVAA